MEPNPIQLRDVVASDLAVFFEYQADPEASHLAAFTAKNPSDRKAFADRWAKILDDPTVIKRTVTLEGQVVGHIASFKPADAFADNQNATAREVTYWIGKQYWGSGIATQALQKLLDIDRQRPIYARVATDNLASIRVLEKCDFSICGTSRGFANARGQVVDEMLLKRE